MSFTRNALHSIVHQCLPKLGKVQRPAPSDTKRNITKYNQKLPVHLLLESSIWFYLGLPANTTVYCVTVWRRLYIKYMVITLQIATTINANYILKEIQQLLTNPAQES